MIPWLDETLPVFPSSSGAHEEPNGLLCAGGNLEVDTLVTAYQQGIFPWPIEDYPLLWWSPNPRMVLTPESFQLSRRQRRFLRKMAWQVVVNQNFAEVIEACAITPRMHQDGSWITSTMQQAYNRLHEAGFAHSIEVRDEQGMLCGGLYGVSIGRVFFGESMFAWQSNASKVALAFLVHSGCYDLIDCQMETEHLQRQGAYTISRERFLEQVDHLSQLPATMLATEISKVSF